jgi:hypothetical protein
MHSPTAPRQPARVVYTRKCPDGTDMESAEPSSARDRSGGISPSKLAPVVAEAD